MLRMQSKRFTNVQQVHKHFNLFATFQTKALTFPSSPKDLNFIQPFNPNPPIQMQIPTNPQDPFSQKTKTAKR